MKAMPIVRTYRHWPAPTVLSLVLTLVLGMTVACARSKPFHSGDTSAPQELPFHSDIEQTSGGGERPLPNPDPSQSSSLPFRAASHPRILPSGTLLTVDLDGALSTLKVHSGDAFAATVAAPLTIDGETLIQRGTAVRGRVESAQSRAGYPGSVASSGYFRLTLDAITIEGRPIVVQTSSLFARGTLLQPQVISRHGISDARSEGIRVQKGRPLTFRLTAPVRLDDSISTANRPASSRSTD